MVRYFIATAAICSAASLVASAHAAKHQKRRHLRKLQASVPTYFPTLSPIADELETIQERSIDLGATMEAASSSTSMGSTVTSAGTITVKDDSWKCSAKPIEVRNWSAQSWGAPAISTIDEVWYGSAGYAIEGTSSSVGGSGKPSVSSGASWAGSSTVSNVGVNGGKAGKRVTNGSTSEVASEAGWSTGDGWHSASGGRRLNASWGAPAVVLESPEIVWVGTSQALSQEPSAKTNKVESTSAVASWGSSVMKVSTSPLSSAKAATSNTVGWGSSVSLTSTNAPTICQTTVAEASPTKYPTEAPTSCSSRFSIWSFNIENGKCVNDGTVSEFLVGEYVSMDKCCEAQFPDQEQYEYCRLYLYEDKCCSMENHLWFYDSLLEVCTNDVTMVNESTEFYNEVIDCCKGEFDNLSICPIRDVCIPEPPETIITSEPTEKPTLAPSDEPTPAPSKEPTPAPSKEPTPTPSASPTTCADLYSVWYYDVTSGKCVTGLDDSEKEVYDSVDECCGAQFPDVAEYEFCIEYLHVDTCCLMENNVWHFDGEVCTNEGGMGSEGYDEDFECCVSQFGQFPCPVENICIPEIPEATPPTVQPSTPELATSAPSVREIITMEPTTAPVTAEPTTFAPISPPPTEKELVTLVPTPPIVTPEPSTMAPSINEILTSTPTFGSTPTVSKETTGPPTQVRAGSRASSTFTEDVNTDCVEHNDKVWSTDSKSMIDVCVYVCTVTTTIYEGEEVYDTKVHETNSECP